MDEMKTLPFRLLVTGSRDWINTAAVHGELETVRKTLAPGQHMTVVHGACLTGADDIARKWALTRATDGVTEEGHPALWRLHRKKAGPIRNQYMVSLGADLCLAFPGPCTRPRCRFPQPHPSHGTSGCIDLARDAGIEVKDCS